MRRALGEFVVKGIKTSIPFHRQVMRHPKFIEGRYDTGFIENHMNNLEEDEVGRAQGRRVAMMIAAVSAYRRDKERAERASTQTSGSSENPWKNFGRRSQLRGGL